LRKEAPQIEERGVVNLLESFVSGRISVVDLFDDTTLRLEITLHKIEASLAQRVEEQAHFKDEIEKGYRFW